jgi:hypothetical protein
MLTLPAVWGGSARDLGDKPPSCPTILPVATNNFR